MTTETITLKLTFTEPLLGTASGNTEIHEEFIASKAPTATDAKEEIETLSVGEQIQKASTVFHRDETGLFVWDYQLRGFFKEAIAALIELGECKISKWGYKRAVDSFLFVGPRRIYVLDTNGKRYPKAPTTLQRPLRADTMQGERVALARSEMLPVGTWLQANVKLLKSSNPKTKSAIITRELVVSCLEYGALKGFGQWRSGGYGRFMWEEVK